MLAEEERDEHEQRLAALVSDRASGNSPGALAGSHAACSVVVVHAVTLSSRDILPAGLGPWRGALPGRGGLDV